MNQLFLSAILLVSFSGIQAGKWNTDGDDYIPQLDDRAAQLAQQLGYGDCFSERGRSISPTESNVGNFERRNAKAATIAQNKKRDERRKAKGIVLSPIKRK